MNGKHASRRTTVESCDERLPAKMAEATPAELQSLRRFPDNGPRRQGASARQRLIRARKAFSDTNTCGISLQIRWSNGAHILRRDG